jgi:hypothetical protein
MTRLTSRVQRLEDGDGRYCTLGEIMDAIEVADCGSAMQALKPLDPRLAQLLAAPPSSNIDDPQKVAGEH